MVPWLHLAVWNGGLTCSGVWCVQDVILLICQRSAFIPSTQRYAAISLILCTYWYILDILCMYQYVLVHHGTYFVCTSMYYTILLFWGRIPYWLFLHTLTPSRRIAMMLPWKTVPQLFFTCHLCPICLKPAVTKQAQMISSTTVTWISSAPFDHLWGATVSHQRTHGWAACKASDKRGKDTHESYKGNHAWLEMKCKCDLCENVLLHHRYIPVCTGVYKAFLKLCEQTVLLLWPVGHDTMCV